MLARERRRLRKVFSVALLAAAAPPALYACTEAPTLRPTDAGAGDAFVDDEEDTDGTISDARSDGPVTYDVVCNPTLTFIDGGDGAVDADPDAAKPFELCSLFLPCGLPADLAAIGCTVTQIGRDGSTSLDAAIGCDIPEDAGCTLPGYKPTVPLGLLCNCDIFAGGGRVRNAFARAPAGTRETAVGDYLAQMAQNEAASVEAFRELAGALRALGAPEALVREAARSAGDEARHASLMTRAARRSGSEPLRARRRAGGRRIDLERLARENVVQGCVFETYAALVAHWQARHAGDLDLRRTFARIAADETRHAALAWAIGRWATSRLSADARRRVARARNRAALRLRRSLAHEPDAALVARAGVPDAAHARALLRALEA
jgi:hypothetical protein